MKAPSEATKIMPCLFLVGLLLGGGAVVRGQTVPDGFDPNANGRVYAVVVQPDGKILIGGDFTTLKPNGGPTVTRNRIARLNPDGSVDAAFDPNANANNSVYSIALQADGQILVGGVFTSIHGQPRNRIARLAPNGLLDTAFNPNASSDVRSIVVQPDGLILAGGLFQSIGGQSRNRIARLFDTGLNVGKADSFDPNSNGYVNTITLQTDNKILAGGNFTTLKPNGGPTVIRNRIARLNPDGSVDAAFGPSASDTVFSIAVQADGHILVGGQFTNVSTVTRNRIARLKPDGTLDTAFNPDSNGVVRSIVVQADGKILVGGQFAGLNAIGGYTRNGIARLHPTGKPDSFDPNANNYVWAIAVQADGKILAGGDFTTLAPYGRGAAVPRNRVARQPKCDC